jgi:hypothetical protein
LKTLKIRKGIERNPNFVTNQVDERNPFGALPKSAMPPVAGHD